MYRRPVDADWEAAAKDLRVALAKVRAITTIPCLRFDGNSFEIAD